MRVRTRLAAVLWLCSSGCIQVAGLSDYAVSDDSGATDASEPDATLDSQISPSTEPDAELDGRTEAQSMDVFSADVLAPDAVVSALIPDAAVSLPDAMPETDSGSTCNAPNQLCGSACVALDDPRHCGSCEHDCTALPQVAGPVSCVAGQCAIPASSCAPGFAHCSASAEDGCETDVTTDRQCGGCGLACTAEQPLCAASQAGATRACVSDCVAPSPAKCGATCVDTTTSPANCGRCGMACPTVPRGTATCNASQCSFTCNASHHRCGDQCLADNSPASCGSSCTPCSAPANATATCGTGGVCEFACTTSYHRCGAQCVPNNAASSCGSSCTPCTAPANATATCGATGACDFVCSPNFHRCGNACVPDASVTQCGAACQVCPQVANATTQCLAGACATTCDLGGAPVNGTCPPPGPPNIVFVSAGKVVGNTGIATADTMCQNEASSAGLAGSYRALMSTETVAATSRLGASRGWVRPDGKPFADRIGDFFASTNDAYRIFYPPRITAAGADAGRVYVLTGTTQSGTPNTGYTCASWTVTDGATSGFGVSSGAGYLFSSGYSTGCSTQFSVYCFGIGNVSRVIVTPVSGRKAFMSKSAWAPGGGIATADSLCQSEATAAGFSGTFRALLATEGASAASRFNTTGSPWVRPDGVPIMPTAAQMFQGNTTMWDVALNTTADLSLQFGNWLVYSGEPTPGAGVNPLTQPGTAASTCDNWTSSAAGSGRGGAGTASNSTLLEAFADKQWGCNYGGSARIVCLQQ